MKHLRVRGGLLAGLALAVLLALASMLPPPKTGDAIADGDGFNFDGKLPGDHAVPLLNPRPDATHWEERPIGGFWLMTPDKKHKVRVPDGWLLEIPHAVPAGYGDDPDSTS